MITRPGDDRDGMRWSYHLSVPLFDFLIFYVTLSSAEYTDPHSQNPRTIDIDERKYQAYSISLLKLLYEI
jgi:hypothetical protein